MRLMKFFVGIPLGFALIAGLWFGLFYLQLGTPSFSAQWVHDVIAKKQDIARQIRPDDAGRRLLFLGGSNVLFGIDAERIGRQLNVPAVNLGLSAVLRIDQIFSVARHTLQAGDTLILALEYPYYQFNKTFSNVELDYTMAFDADYFRALPLQSQVPLMLNVSAIRLFRGLEASVFSAGKSNASYAVATIDSFGDATSNVRATMPEAYIRHNLKIGPVSHRIDPANRFWTLYADFLQWCEAHEVRVMVTFPTYLYFPVYEEPAQRKFFDGIVEWHRSRHIPLLGTPYDFMVQPEYLYDTRHHLNDEGRVIRTDRLIDLLREQPVWRQ